MRVFKPGASQQKAIVHAWFLEIAFVQEVGMHLCVSAPWLQKTIHVK